MAKFRKRTAEIEAVRFDKIVQIDGGDDEFAQFSPPIPPWVIDAFKLKPHEVGRLWIGGDVDGEGALYLSTPEGASFISPGDWIINDSFNRLTVCPAEVFEVTYIAE